MVDVIYIEDEEAEALLLQIGLSARGINVLHIPNAAPESLSLLGTPAYRNASVVFFDLWIIDVNGIELARSLRQAGDTRPFFLVTAADNPNPALLDQLDIGYLSKPLNYDRVAGLIKRLTGG